MATATSRWLVAAMAALLAVCVGCAADRTPTQAEAALGPRLGQANLRVMVTERRVPAIAGRTLVLPITLDGPIDARRPLHLTAAGAAIDVAGYHRSWMEGAEPRP